MKPSISKLAKTALLILVTAWTVGAHAGMVLARVQASAYIPGQDWRQTNNFRLNIPSVFDQLCFYSDSGYFGGCGIALDVSGSDPTIVTGISDGSCVRLDGRLRQWLSQGNAYIGGCGLTQMGGAAVIRIEAEASNPSPW